MTTSRREFLAHGAAGASLLATGLSLPGFLARTAWAAAPRRDSRVLVVVQLTGGNDGLNCVIPFRDDFYHRARPTLRVPEDRALRLTDELALHPDMVGFKRLFDDGWLSVVTNVGYPNPDRSHFRSMDIWHTALLEPERAADGWLGRVVDADTSDAARPTALHLDDGALPLALKSRRHAVPSIRDVDALALPRSAEQVAAALDAPRPGASDDLLYVQRVAVSSCANAARLANLKHEADAQAAYPAYGLGNRLRQIARLIAADFGPRVYYTTLGGFDTHARQALAHGPLLRELAESVAAFYVDLRARRLADRVLLLTFSEFGRRVAENGSQGTDHGAAAPMFLAGPACRPGVTGKPPDLANLVEGDVRHELDFRQVYACVLKDWLGMNDQAVLHGRFVSAGLLRA